LAGIEGVADAAHLDAADVLPATGRIGGYRFERFVRPPGPPPADSEEIQTDGGCWIKLQFVCAASQILWLS
jgi:hypothetical protein